jgi:hypothetical protein
MILNEIRSIKSGRRERHQFGVVIFVASLLIGAFLWWRKDLYPGVFIAGFICVAPVAFDKIFRTDTAIVLLPVQKVWMAFAVVMGLIMSTLILSVFFFGVFTAVRAINGLIGKSLLDTAWDPASKDTYWIKRDDSEYDSAQSEKQY